jgi:hypothetical protein
LLDITHKTRCLVSPAHLSPSLALQVPEISAFWLLTLIPQLPIVVFIGFIPSQDGPHPLETAVSIMMLGFLLAELRAGFSAARGLIRKQTADF